MFLDESGFSSKTTKVRTWGRCGQTPMIPTKLRWEHLSVLGAITTKVDRFCTTCTAARCAHRRS